MKNEDWQIVMRIVTEALNLSGKERKGYLENCYRRHPTLISEIKSLIKEDEPAKSFFETPAAFRYADFFEEENVERVGEKIGNYHIVKELAAGGMGIVYLAERIDGKFDQQVAIKILRREYNTSVIRNRFEIEKEIQAKLIHPSIVRLIDAGTTVDGIPYLAMEYIEGVNILEYCRKENRSLKERLKLFNKVCNAVAFAHRNLIIHRDLKPSNIIITKNGEPKLLDFGISKLLDEEFDETHTVTKMGVMTPEYASPEQIKRENVTTSTDIYSLGVILFELLTGQRPFEYDFRNYEDLFKAIGEKEPERPSDILSQIQYIEIPEISDEKFLEDKKAEQNEPDTQILEKTKTQKLINETKLQTSIINPNQLRGDIDNIILKTLRKEPERRYQTVEQLSADIWRHLDGMPVSARPATFSYRASKFIKRNRYSVMASGLIILVIISGLIATLWQARRAELQRAKAEKRFNDVRELAHSNLYKVYPAVERLEGSIEARKEIVENALKYLDSLSKEASDNTELQLELADAYIKIGDVQGNQKYPNLGDAKGSLKSYENAQILVQTVYEKNQNDFYLKDKFAKILEKEGYVLWWEGDNPKTYEKYKKALALRKELVESNPNSVDYQLSLAGLYIDYGDVPYWEDKNEQANDYYKLAFGILEKLARENPNEKEIQIKYAHSHNRLSKINLRYAEYKEAVENLRIAEKIYQKLVTQNPTRQNIQKSLWAAQISICEVYLFEENAANAVENCPKVINMQKKFFENEPSNVTAVYNLSIAYYYVSEAFLLNKNFKEATEFTEKGLTLIEKILKMSPKNFGYRHQKINLTKVKAETFWKQENFQKALRIYEKLIESYKDILKENPEDSRAKIGLFKVYSETGQIYLEQNNKLLAKKWLSRSYDSGQELLKAKSLSEKDKKLLNEVKFKLEKLV